MNDWNKKHIDYWKNELVIDADGFSVFQKDLASKVEKILDKLNLQNRSETTIYPSLTDSNLEVKLITYFLKDETQSKVWIYHDMAEYDLNKTHHIYEEWGYLKPQDLKDEFIKSMKNELKNCVQ